MTVSINDSCKPEKGWFRGGSDVSYYKNNVDHIFYRNQDEIYPANNVNSNANNGPNNNTTGVNSSNMNNNQNNPNIIDRNFQSLDWTYSFTEKGQRVVFAYCYPFSFTDLARYLEKQEELMIRRVIQSQDFDKDN